MSRVGGINSKPEKIVRSLLHNLGYRFRLHRKDLPGKPDIVLPKHKKIIFVHGCFWHSHPGCSRAKRPTSNKKFWAKKLNRNVERGGEVINNLQELGWRSLIIWTCEVKDQNCLEKKLTSFIEIK